jgi:hypothetical protein
MYYLGKYGSEASRREYDRIIAEFVANGRQPFYHPDEILIENLIAQFLVHAETERKYSTTAQGKIDLVLRQLNKLYGKQPVSAFNPFAFKVMRKHFLEQGLSRDTINDYTSIIRYVFSWGFDEAGIVPAEISGALKGELLTCLHYHISCKRAISPHVLWNKLGSVKFVVKFFEGDT